MWDGLARHLLDNLMEWKAKRWFAQKFAVYNDNDLSIVYSALSI
jgi:hypothetical protein